MNKSLSFNDDTVHYSKVGAGKPLVFLHGFLEDSSIWNQIEKVLVKEHQLILIDLPGHGLSQVFGIDQSMTSMANLVKLICLKENVNNPIVFGHSMGGYVALELSKIFDIDIALVHSNFWADSLEKRKDRDRVLKIVEVNLALFVSSAIPNLFFEINRKKCETDIKAMIASASALRPEVVMSVTEGMRDRVDNAHLLATNRVAIIQGDSDPVFSREMMTNQLKKVNNQPVFIEISDCGHMGFVEQPDAFLSAVKVIIHKFSS